MTRQTTAHKLRKKAFLYEVCGLRAVGGREGGVRGGGGRRSGDMDVWGAAAFWVLGGIKGRGGGVAAAHVGT